ncbi:T/G mismatch-specific endonuclease [Actinopolyspora alba]|uniref:T/G mismatch-specific endonuclease n=1 Tax=Actinopolyspora alba TaxID=673379 RepID=A0A1I1Y937_9ACTN|nr:very short patch repair endonuclease [Actinopolyspora alba]SFE16071.1 T/G mismatch-specific endonuclease [Actinopolyspora alba]
MSRQKRRDTGPEMQLRRTLHRMGLRYRVNLPLPGMPRRRADVTFTRARLAIFVDGCFWHRCPRHGTDPANNSSWWARKLNSNVARDRETDERLREAGWNVLRFWEHEDMSEAATRVAALLSELPGNTSSTRDDEKDGNTYEDKGASRE